MEASSKVTPGPSRSSATRAGKKFLAIPEEERWALVGAETDEEVIARFEVASHQSAPSTPRGSRIVVVSHGGVMRAFLREHFGTRGPARRPTGGQRFDHTPAMG